MTALLNLIEGTGRKDGKRTRINQPCKIEEQSTAKMPCDGLHQLFCSILSRLSQPRLRRPPIVGSPQFQEIFVKLDHRSKRVLNMFVDQHLFPESGEISRKRDDVAYLSSIQVYLRELMDVLLKIVNIDALFGFGEHADEITPDLHALILVEFGVANS